MLGGTVVWYQFVQTGSIGGQVSEQEIYWITWVDFDTEDGITVSQDGSHQFAISGLVMPNNGMWETDVAALLAQRGNNNVLQQGVVLELVSLKMGEVDITGDLDMFAVLVNNDIERDLLTGQASWAWTEALAERAIGFRIAATGQLWAEGTPFEALVTVQITPS